MQKIKSPEVFIVSHKMTTQEIISQILAKNPKISQLQIMEKLQEERKRTNGLLGDETLLRLIAAKYGVQVDQNTIQNSRVLSISRLVVGLNDVTVAGRLIAVFQVRSFEGEKPGKFATLMIADKDGVLRVVLWNERTEHVEKGELKAGQAVRFLHGYTRADRYGQVELHLGSKSQIDFNPQENCDYPPLEKYTTKIGALTKTSGTVHLIGVVKQVLGSSTFTRSDASEGVCMRFVFTDNSGEVTVVAWNEKATEVENCIKNKASLQFVNARVKEGLNGGFEVHVDSNTFVNANS